MKIIKKIILIVLKSIISLLFLRYIWIIKTNYIIFDKIIISLNTIILFIFTKKLKMLIKFILQPIIHFLGKRIYSKQYIIYEDMKKISIKDISLKNKINEINKYYENKNYTLEEYLSRLYYLDHMSSGKENIKYGLYTGFILFVVTKLCEYGAEAYNTSNIGNTILDKIIAICSLIFTTTAFTFFFMLFVIWYFVPTPSRGLNKVLNEEEIKFVSEKINEIKKQ